MKRQMYFKALWTFLAMFSCLSLAAAEPQDYELNESFESGIPNSWKQETEKGNVLWKHEKTNLTDPAFAAEGDAYISMRNTGNQSTGFATKIISPEIDVDQYITPVVIFSYSMDKRSGNNDILKVYYRIDAEGDWKLLKEITDYSTLWTSDTLELPMKSTTYSLAFEGADRLGKGVVIDNIQVRECPSCNTAASIDAVNVDTTTTTITWASGGMDATKYRLLLNSSPLTPRMLLDPDLQGSKLDIEINQSSLNQYQLENLEKGKRYYAYVRTLCGTENSTWSKECTFITKSTVVLPYLEDFNAEYSGLISKQEGWYFFADNTDEEIPFINTSTPLQSLKNLSKDATTSLIFATLVGGNVDFIPEEVTAYAVSPEVTGISSMKELQITFAGAYSGGGYMAPFRGFIKMGVMTDPEDVASIQILDSLSITSVECFKEFVINLADANDDARHLVFMSDANVINRFYVDDILIQKIPTCSKAHTIVPSFKSSTVMGLSWDDMGSTGGEVMLCSERIEDFDDIDESTILLKPKAIPNPATIEGLTPWTEYYVYVRNTKGLTNKGIWSDPVIVRSPDTIQTSMFYDFEPKTDNYDLSGGKLPKGVIGLCLHILSPPNLGEQYFQELGRQLNILSSFSYEGEEVAYVIFPEIENIKGYKVSFLQAGYKTTSIEIGIMEDIHDPESFVVLDKIDCLKGVPKRYAIDFSKYMGEGKFFAFKYQNSESVYIDDLELKPVPTCDDPQNIEASTTATTASLTWDAGNATQWEMKVSTFDNFDNINSPNGWIYKDTLDNASAELEGLVANGKKHFCYIRAICGDDDRSDWVSSSFLTQCASMSIFPYVIDFQWRAAYGDGNFNDIPCYAFRGNALVSLSPWGTCQAIIEHSDYTGHTEDSYFVLPELGEDLNNIYAQVTVANRTWSETGDYGTLEVGVMTDPEDNSTFQSFGQIARTQTAYNTYEILDIYFPNYEGGGKYIAFRSPKDSYGKYEISNITIKDRGVCPNMRDVAASDILGTSATISWIGDIETAWDLVVSKYPLYPSDIDRAMAAGSIADTTVFAGDATNPQAITGLFYNTRYYAYARAKCSEDVNSDWSPAGEFRTTCGVLTIDQMPTEDFDTYGDKAKTLCWTIGNSSESGSRMPFTSPKYKHSGAYSLFFDTFMEGAIFDSKGFAVSPEIDIDSIKRASISFWGSSFYNPAVEQNLGQLTVGIVTDPEDLSTYEEIAVVNNYGKEHYYTIPFDRYINDKDGFSGKFVMFTTDYPSTNNFYIDDVSYDYISDEIAPARVKVEDVGMHSAKIKWELGKAPYRVILSKRTLDYDSLNLTKADEDVEIFTTDNRIYDFETLDLRTKYYVYVASVYGTDTLWANIIGFETLCMDKSALPFTADFDDAPFTGMWSMPDCWTCHYSDINMHIRHPQIIAEGYKSSNSLHLNAESFTKTSYAVMPKVDAPVNETLLSFYAAIKNPQWGNPFKQVSLVVGVVTDISSIARVESSFKAIDTILVTSQDYQKYYIPMDKYKGTEGHIAFTTKFRYNLTTSGSMDKGGPMIDQIKVDSLPSCMFPDFLKVTDAEPTALSIEFSELKDATKWEMLVVKDGEAMVESNAISLDATQHKIEDLENNTLYSVYVRSVCSADDKSTWTLPVSQKTLTEAVVEYPHNEDFEGDEAAVWHSIAEEGGNAWAIGSAANVGGEKGVYISNDGGTSAEYDTTKTSHSYLYRTLYLESGIYDFTYNRKDLGEATAGNFTLGLLHGDAMLLDASTTVSYSDESTSTINSELIRLTDFDLQDGDIETGYVEILNDMVGYYNLVLYWNRTEGIGNGEVDSSMVLDNISIVQSSCVKPITPYIGRTTSSDADMKWDIIGSTDNYTEWQVAVTTGSTLPDSVVIGKDSIYVGTADTTNTIVYNLKENTSYRAYVRAKCSEGGDYTVWSESISFRTPCNPIPVGTVYDFEEAVDYCVKQGNFINQYGAAFKIEENQFETALAFEGEKAMYLSSWYPGGDGAYFALPHIEGSLDNVQISFWMRPFTHLKANGLANMNFGSIDATSKTIGIAAINDFKDTATITMLQDCIYPYSDKDVDGTTFMREDINGRAYWMKFSIPLKGYDGQQIMLFDASYGRANLYIDSVTIEYMPPCPTPRNLSIVNIKDVEADVTFDHTDGESWEIVYATDAKMSNPITVTATSLPATLEGLTPNTEYFIKVRQVSDEGESDWTFNKKFTTVHKVRYDERFSKEVMVPEDWSRSIDEDLKSVFANPEPKFTPIWNSELVGWGYSALTDDVSAHQKVSYIAPTYMQIEFYWMFSPVVHLKDNENAYLSFDMALTATESFDPISEHIEKRYNVFAVLISDDGGLTWKESNATIWDEQGGVFANAKDLYSISNSWESMRIDLDEHKGKNIMVAFYTETKSSIAFELHIDNIYINSYKNESITEQICEHEDYVHGEIIIPSTELKVGHNEKDIYVLSVDGSSDTQYKFDIEVEPMPKATLTGEICANDVYSGNGFANITTAGVHHIVSPLSSERCDSLTELTLTVNPLGASTFDTTVCAGHSITWNGKEYNTAGNFTDTIRANEGDDACDSIVTMNLITLPSLEGERTHILCEGEKIVIDGETFTSDGVSAPKTKVEIIENPSGCDSTITHTIVFTPTYTHVIEATICDGEKYTSGDFLSIGKELPQGYTINPETESGCDSTVTLNLMVIKEGETTRSVERNITTDQLPYDFYGKTFGVDTEEGKYEGTVEVKAESGKCSMSVSYTINVGAVVGVDNVFDSKECALTPNPAAIGEEITVAMIFSDDQLDGMSVEVFTASGTLVQLFEPTSNNITISGLNTSGVYVVRITDGNGVIHMGKVIVK